MRGTPAAVAISLIAQIILTLALTALLDPVTATIVLVASVGLLLIEVSLAVEGRALPSITAEAGDE